MFIYLALVIFSVTFSSSRALRPFLGEEEVEEEELAWWGDKEKVVFQLRNLTFDALINMKESRAKNIKPIPIPIIFSA